MKKFPETLAITNQQMKRLKELLEDIAAHNSVDVLVSHETFTDGSTSIHLNHVSGKQVMANFEGFELRLEEFS